MLESIYFGKEESEVEISDFPEDVPPVVTTVPKRVTYEDQIQDAMLAQGRSVKEIQETIRKYREGKL